MKCVADTHNGSTDVRSFVLVTLVSLRSMFLKWFRLHGEPKTQFDGPTPDTDSVDLGCDLKFTFSSSKFTGAPVS